MVRVLAWACIVLVAEVAAAQSQPGGVRTVYLIRHGAYVADRNADPQLGPGLTPLGIAQARLVAVRLNGSGVSFDSMTVSPLQRARDTAAVMHETLSKVPLTQSALLRECTPTLPEAAQGEVARERAACTRQLDQAFAQFLVPAPGAERNDILVAHGNVIRYLTMKALKVDAPVWAALSVAHASLTVIEVRPDGSARVLAVGDNGHIPSPLVSWGDANDRQLTVPVPPAR
jgi:serine/threonine-protein phosphatase PGAM5